MLGGEQGTGKSTAARLVTGLVDPSPALLRSQPRDVEAWAMAAAGSWCVVIDNVSSIPVWWSDALCKAVTGDGWIRRKLYTDSDLAVLAFRRCVMLTSIDAGALRGDLGDRLLLVDLERIDDGHRRTKSELNERYDDLRPMLFAGLLDAVSRTLAVLPDVELDSLPRMADFARVLAALDKACPELTGGGALELFVGQRKRIATDVVDGDPVAAAIVALMENREEWQGTASELLTAITPKGNDGNPRPPRGWPGSPRGMAAQLKKVTPALRVVGIDVQHDRASDRNRTRRYILRKMGDSTVRTVQSSENQLDAAGRDEMQESGPDGLRTDADGSEASGHQPSDQPSTVTECAEAHTDASNGPSDGADDLDGSNANISTRPGGTAKPTEVEVRKRIEI